MTDIGKLVLFTGYYSMDGVPGAFLSIDTVERRSMVPGGATPSLMTETISISINVSMDGKSCTTYSFSEGATFDGVTLSIPGRLTLDFVRRYSGGRLASFSGRIGSVNVAGVTYYNQVPLRAFVGDYYDVQTARKVLSITPDLVLLFDFEMFMNSSGALREVHSYDYTPAMFVLKFSDARSMPPNAFTLMLGTAAKNGLACSIQGGGTPRLAVSILPFDRKLNS